MKKIYILLMAGIICSCNNTANQPGKSADNTSSTAISEERTDVNAGPVAQYDKALGDLNDWHFDVKLYETKQRFAYKLDMKYQEVTASDTIRFPNFGMDPEPQIKKGNSDLECIIGFLDKEKKFREYIKVSIDNDQLRVKTLKQYAVYEK